MELPHSQDLENHFSKFSPIHINQPFSESNFDFSNQRNPSLRYTQPVMISLVKETNKENLKNESLAKFNLYISENRT